MRLENPDRVTSGLVAERPIAGTERAAAERWHRALRRLLPPSLFARVFAVNALLLIGAVLVLALSPATVSFPVKLTQAFVLACGLVVILTANAVLLRFSLVPLERLARMMRRIDLLAPGDRLKAGGARELAGVVATFNQMLDRLELERRASSTRTVHNQEEERRRIAAELHDEVGQKMTALLLGLKGVIDEAPAALQPQLREMHALVRENLDEVGRIARQLRPTVLDDLGLGYGLLGLADLVEQSTELVVARRIGSDLPRLPADIELALYRIAQEALTNVTRHAAASKVEIVLETLDEHQLSLAVHDDGRGMIYAADLESGGIRGIRERALAAGAELIIESRPGGGTSVVVIAPAALR